MVNLKESINSAYIRNFYVFTDHFHANWRSFLYFNGRTSHIVPLLAQFQVHVKAIEIVLSIISNSGEAE